MKKGIMKLISFCLIFSITFPSNASAKECNSIRSIQEEYEISEYDMIVSVKAGTYQEQDSHRLSEDDIQFIKSGGVEKELLRRASLSEEELKHKFFYSDEAISFLKTYTGTPVEESPELRAILATLNATLTKNFCISDAASVNYAWEWSTFPIIMVNDDIVSVAWDATYTTGNNNMQLIVNTSYSTVWYYYTDTTYQAYNFAVQSADLYHCAYTKFPMSNAFGNARKGLFRVTMGLVNTQNGSNLYQMIAHGEYRHVFPPIAVSISFSLPLSISYTGLGNTYGERNITMYAS